MQDLLADLKCVRDSCAREGSRKMEWSIMDEKTLDDMIFDCHENPEEPPSTPYAEIVGQLAQEIMSRQDCRERDGLSNIGGDGLSSKGREGLSSKKRDGLSTAKLYYFLFKATMPAKYSLALA